MLGWSGDVSRKTVIEGRIPRTSRCIMQLRISGLKGYGDLQETGDDKPWPGLAVHVCGETGGSAPLRRLRAKDRKQRCKSLSR